MKYVWYVESFLLRFGNRRTLRNHKMRQNFRKIPDFVKMLSLLKDSIITNLNLEILESIITFRIKFQRFKCFFCQKLIIVYFWMFYQSFYMYTGKNPMNLKQQDLKYNDKFYRNYDYLLNCFQCRIGMMIIEFISLGQLFDGLNTQKPIIWILPLNMSCSKCITNFLQ